MDQRAIQALAGGVLVGLIVGSVATWLYLERFRMFRADSQSAAVGSSARSPQASPSSAGEQAATANVVEAGAQKAGKRVTVARADIEVPGWVVVYESRAGQPGNALGAILIDQGMHATVTVPLLRGTLKEKTYFVVLHRDDGDRKFELRDDFPLRDSAGNPIMTTFETLP